MKGTPFDRSLPRADLLVHIGLGAAGVAAVILAVGAMLDFGSNVDAIAARLTLPRPEDDMPTFVLDPQSPTNLAARQTPLGSPGTETPTNAQPTAAKPAPNRTAG